MNVKRFFNDVNFMNNLLFYKSKQSFLANYPYFSDEEYDCMRKLTGQIVRVVSCYDGHFTSNLDGEIFYGKGEFCFKDVDNFVNKKGICYIPESAFLELPDDEVPTEETLGGYTYDDLREAIETIYEDCSEEDKDKYTAMLFHELTWMTPEVFLEEFDLLGLY